MLYLGIIAGIFIVEFIIKTTVEKRAKWDSTKALLGGKILLKKHHNKGFMLNILEKRQKVVAIISLFLCLFLSGVVILSGGKYNKLIKLGLSVILGGAYSNTYDRLFRKYVVDYVSLGVKNTKLRKVVFNLADFCIMIGTILVILGGISHENIGEGQICSESDGGFGSSQ